MKMIQILYATFVLLGLIMMYYAYQNYQKSSKLLSSGVKTKATVIDLIRVSGKKGDTFRAVFEYADNAQNIIRFEDGFSSNPASYDVGEKVSIIYSKDSKDRRILSYWSLHRGTILLLCFASPFLIIGLGYFLYIY